jgi:hypothetical protein
MVVPGTRPDPDYGVASTKCFMSLRSSTKDENRPSGQCVVVGSPMSKPLRSRPIDFCLEENGDRFRFPNHPAEMHKLPSTKQGGVASYSCVALYEAYPSDTAVAHCPMRFHETPPHFQRRTRSSRRFASSVLLNFVLFVASFENTLLEDLGSLQAEFSIPSFQQGVREPRLTWMSPDASCGPGW